jgi:hypothetical protein
VLGLALVLGCEESSDDDSRAGEIDECLDLPPLSLSIRPEMVRIAQPVTLLGEGGSGRYTYAVADEGSGGELRGDRFVAGKTPGQDTLSVTDDCGNSSQATLVVSAQFEVAPTRATLRPGTAFQIRVSGMLGEAHFEADGLGSGGSVDGEGNYTAGPNEGLDLIVVTDSGSGEEALLQYRVSRAAALRGSPAVLALPAGASVPLVTQDGSGVLDWSVVSGPGMVEDGVYKVARQESGRAALEARDTFTGETTRVTVHVLSELTHESRPHGRLSDNATVVTGDFDGDGNTDVALGVPESDLGRPTGGAVFVFRGGSEGLPSEPSWTLTGETDTASLGTVLAAGDLDGDGHDDLAVSAPGADVTVADSGAVFLYRFDADGPVPLRAPLTGLGRGNFGAALVIADVDGDEDADLIVGSPGADLAASSNIRSRGVVDVFVLERGKPIPDSGTLRIGGVDLANTGALKSSSDLRFARALAVADFNGDGQADLASLGVVNNSVLNGTRLARNQPAVAVHFGRAATPMFGETPDLFVLPANPADAGEGNFRLRAAATAEGETARLLLSADEIDSPDLSGSGGLKSGSNAGGVYVFDLSAQATPDAAPAMPTQLGRSDAFATLFGDAASINAARSLDVADLDGDGALELVLGARSASRTVKMGTRDVTTSLTGKLLVFPFTALHRGDTLNKPREVLYGQNANDMLGVAVAAWSPQADRHGLVALAGRASTAAGDFTGRLDAFLGEGELASLATSSAELPAARAAEQIGAALSLNAQGDAVRVLVGVPGFSGAGSKGDGNEVGAGQAVLFERGHEAAPRVIHEGAASSYTSNGHAAYGGRNVGSDVAFTDFNGDGRADLVVAAPQLSTPIANNTDYATLPPACVTSAAQNNGGALVFLAQADGSFREGFRVLAVSAITGCTPADSAACKRSNLGRNLIGGFDFDGDGKQDLLLTRNNGLELFLGRAPSDASLAKPSLACDPVFSLPALAQGVSAPAALADLDLDGCDEVALRYSDNDRSGVVIAFGFSSDTTRCKGHNAAAWLRVVGDPEKGLSNLQLGVASAYAGKVLADARTFVAISAGLFPLEGVVQPAVLLFDAAQLAKARPSTGEAVVGALQDGLTPLAFAYRDRSPGFGRALAGNTDLDGDGVVDLVVAAPGASINGDGTGAVFVFRGAAKLSGKLEPWLTLVGDGSERASVGQDLSVVAATARTPAALAVGAPLSYRTGTANGTAWLLAL